MQRSNIHLPCPLLIKNLCCSSQSCYTCRSKSYIGLKARSLLQQLLITSNENNVIDGIFLLLLQQSVIIHVHATVELLYTWLFLRTKNIAT